MSTQITSATDDLEIELDRHTYVWDGERWYEKQTFMAPSSQVLQRLNSMIDGHLSAADEMIFDPAVLIRKAAAAKNLEQYLRAERLARRALQLDARNEAAAAVLSSVLRSSGKADEAVALTSRYPHTVSAPLLTTRAAALCDLGHWSDALRAVRKALACSRSGNGETFAVYHRIKAAAPELF